MQTNLFIQIINFHKIDNMFLKRSKVQNWFIKSILVSRIVIHLLNSETVNCGDA